MADETADQQVAQVRAAVIEHAVNLVGAWLTSIEAGRGLAEELATQLAASELWPGIECPEATVLRAGWVQLCVHLFDVGMAAMRQAQGPTLVAALANVVAQPVQDLSVPMDGVGWVQ